MRRARDERQETRRERTRLVSVVPELRRHEVRCVHCATSFDLFAAPWCAHAEPSKRCAHCDQCLCARPEYADPRLFAPAPPAFVRQGFRRLFVAYL